MYVLTFHPYILGEISIMNCVLHHNTIVNIVVNFIHNFQLQIYVDVAILFMSFGAARKTGDLLNTVF